MAIETVVRWLVCPCEACESRCNRVTGVPMKGGGGDDAMTVILLACSGSKGGNGSNSVWWLSGALSHTTDLASTWILSILVHFFGQVNSVSVQNLQILQHVPVIGSASKNYTGYRRVYIYIKIGTDYNYEIVSHTLSHHWIIWSITLEIK